MFQRETSGSPLQVPKRGLASWNGAGLSRFLEVNVSRPPRNGVEGALELLRGLEPATQERILAEIAEREPELHRTLQERLPDFERVLKVPAEELRSVYLKSDPDLWTQALRGAAPPLVAHVLASLPERARRELEDRIASLGPIPRSRVEAARTRIAKLLPVAPSSP